MKKDNCNKQQQPKNRLYYQGCHDKCLSNAKECIAAGDCIQAEYCYQKAEYFLRVMNEKFPLPQQEPQIQAIPVPQMIKTTKPKRPRNKQNTSVKQKDKQAEIGVSNA